MHKIRSFYNSNRAIIWIIIGCLGSVILMLQVFNNNAKKKNIEISTKDITSSSNTTIYPNVPEKENKNADTKEILYNFMEECNEGNIEVAYNLLSTDCKEEMFPNLEEFKNKYINTIFSTKKTYDIQPWIANKYSIYKISIYPNALETGNINDDEEINSYYTVVKENDEYKVNLNNFVAKESLENENENENIAINIICRKIYMDYEEYEIKITNKTLKTILMDGYRKNNSVYILDSVGTKKNAYINEIAERLLVIEPLLNITRTIRFNKAYSEQVVSKVMFFNDIILDYNEYKKTDNKNEYNNFYNIEVNVQR